MGTIDNTNRQTLGIITTPSGINAYFEGVFTIASTNTRTLICNIVPQSTQLSLWNFLFTVVVDDTITDSNGDFTYAVPYGSGFIFQDPKSNCIVQHWTDWGRSSDTNNQRYNMIKIQNNDTVSHTYYVFYKAYTWAN